MILYTIIVFVIHYFCVLSVSVWLLLMLIGGFIACGIYADETPVQRKKNRQD